MDGRPWVLGMDVPWAGMGPRHGRPIQAVGPSFSRSHPSRGSIGAHPCSRPIHAEGPYLPSTHLSPGSIHDQSPSTLRAHPRPRPIQLMAHGGLSIARAHSCRGPSMPMTHSWQGPLHDEGSSMPRVYLCWGPTLPRAHQYRRPISARRPSLSKAHGGPTITRAHPSREPMPALGTSIARAHGVHFYAQGPSMPRVNPCPGPSIPRANPCLGPFHTAALSLTAMGAIHTEGPSLAQCPSFSRVHGSSSMSRTPSC